MATRIDPAGAGGPLQTVTAGGSGARWRQYALPYLYIAPAAVILAIITFYPIFYSVYLSFTNFGLKNLRGTPPDWVWFRNYERIIRGELPITNFDFWRILSFNLTWTIVNVFFHVVIGIAVALLLNKQRIVGRNDEERRRILNFEKVDVVIAMTIAGLVNMSMVVVAAGLFNAGGLTGIDTIEGAYDGIAQTVSQNAATVFGVALLASGLASTSVGTMAGQVIMQGFIDRRIPLNLRRAITLAPALIILAIGLDPTRALVISQVVLSFGIPFALIPLLLIARKKRVMGALVNPTWLTAFAAVLAAAIICLNAFLLFDLFVG